MKIPVLSHLVLRFVWIDGDIYRTNHWTCMGPFFPPCKVLGSKFRIYIVLFKDLEFSTGRVFFSSIKMASNLRDRGDTRLHKMVSHTLR